MSAYENLRKMEMQVNGSMMILTSPADLYVIAPCGFLMTHWKPFIGRLIGHHLRPTRSSFNDNTDNLLQCNRSDAPALCEHDLVQDQGAVSEF